MKEWQQTCIVGFCLSGFIGGIFAVAFYLPTWTPENIEKCYNKPEWCQEEMPHLYQSLKYPEEKINDK